MVIIRDVEELAVFNDEAHHIHNPKMAWFKSIQDIHHRMLQKDRRLALQVDVTATPRHDNGAIFVQTVSDYPLVEAIHQNVVKHPVLPDAASRAKLHEATSALRWTGAYIFENEWQSFRTRQKRALDMTTAPHAYEAPGRYTIAVKVIDIFGNDTMTLAPVTVG